MKMSLLSALSAAALLTGCAVGPDYQAPGMPPVMGGPFVASAEPVFASEEEARRNSDRPEQNQWWIEAQYD